MDLQRDAARLATIATVFVWVGWISIIYALIAGALWWFDLARRPAFNFIEAFAISAAAKSLIADTVAIIDIFLIGTVLFVISAGLYQLFVHHDISLPGWLRIESLDDLKDNLTEVIVVAILVAFLGQAVEWTSDVNILAFGVAVAAVIVAVAALTWVTRRKTEP